MRGCSALRNSGGLSLCDIPSIIFLYKKVWDFYRILFLYRICFYYLDFLDIFSFGKSERGVFLK